MQRASFASMLGRLKAHECIVVRIECADVTRDCGWCPRQANEKPCPRVRKEVRVAVHDLDHARLTLRALSRALRLLIDEAPNGSARLEQFEKVSADLVRGAEF